MNFEKEPETPPTRKSLYSLSDIMRVVVAILLIIGSLYSVYAAWRTIDKQDCYVIDHNQSYSYLSDGKNPSWFVKVVGTHVETGKRKWLHTTAPEIIGHTKICEPADKNVIETIGIVLTVLALFAVCFSAIFVLVYLLMVFIFWLLNKPI